MMVTLESLENVKNAILVDIREEYEREIFCLDRALNIPMENLMEEVSNFSKNNQYILFCQSGNRSTNMVKVLRSNGFANFHSLEGGANLMSERNFK